MALRSRFAVLALSVPLLAAAGTPQEQEPRYEPATVVSTRMVVAEVKDVPKGSPLAGVHLLARPESARADSEPVDVYLAPADFMKQMDLTFHPHDRIDVTGSKVKLGAAPVILAREVRRDTSTIYIRDEKGEPVWKLLLK